MLNGNRYDASTGELISESSNTPPQPHKSGANIDGFVSKKKVSTPRKPHAISRPALKSRTLMRSAVKKPSVPQVTKTQPSTPTIKTSPQLVDPRRELRAKQVNRSNLISKFGSGAKKITKYSPLPITPAPTNSAAITKESNHKQKASTSQSRHNPDSTTTKKNTFEQAIKNSTSHTNAKIKKQTKRHKLAKRLHISPSLLNISIVAVTVMVLGGYFAYNNVPNLAMRVASTRAGISGALPDYQPSGYAIKGPIQYKPGQITISFASNSDGRSYSVAQRNSDWNSEALLENHVATNNRQYQTFQDNGKTIYMYDGDSASWVDNGIWYEIDGNSSLNTDQVLRIASSL